MAKKSASGFDKLGDQFMPTSFNGQTPLESVRSPSQKLGDHANKSNISNDFLARAYVLLLEIARHHEMETLTSRDTMDRKQKDDPISVDSTDRA